MNFGRKRGFEGNFSQGMQQGGQSRFAGGTHRENESLRFNRLFILGGRGLTEDDWREQFSKYGNIQNVWCRKDESGQYKGVTYIRFDKASEACRGLEDMNGQHLGEGPKPLKVMLAHEKRNQLELDCDEETMLLRLFIRVPKSHTLDDIKSYFSQFGKVTWAHILKNKETNESRGLAFVKFSRQSESAKAFEECNDSYKPKWADVRIKQDDEMGQDMMGGGMDSMMGGGMDSMMGGGMMGNAGNMMNRGGNMRGRSGNMMGGAGNMMGGARNMMGGGGNMMGGGGNMMGGGGGMMGNRRGMMGGGFGDQGFGMGGGFDMGGGGFDMGGGGFDMDSGMGGDMGAMNVMPEKEMPAPGDPMYIIESRSDIGSDRLEALVPADMTQQQVFALFNIAPGLESCSLDTNTGLAKLQYQNAKCASFAQEKIDGMDYAGHKMAVRFGKVSSSKALKATAAQLQETLMSLTTSGNADPAQLSSLVESIQKVTEAIQSQGGEDDMEAEANGMEMTPWCSVPLPMRKPFATRDSSVVERLFFVSVPDTFPNDLLENAFCRFGDLVKVRFQTDKRFGFAHYASKEAAELCQKTLHGQCILNNRLKIEYASAPKRSENGDS